MFRYSVSYRIVLRSGLILVRIVEMLLSGSVGNLVWHSRSRKLCGRETAIHMCSNESLPRNVLL